MNRSWWKLSRTEKGWNQVRIKDGYNNKDLNASQLTILAKSLKSNDSRLTVTQIAPHHRWKHHFFTLIVAAASTKKKTHRTCCCAKGFLQKQRHFWRVLEQKSNQNGSNRLQSTWIYMEHLGVSLDSDNYNCYIIDMNPVNQHSHGKCPPCLMGPLPVRKHSGILPRVTHGWVCEACEARPFWWDSQDLQNFKQCGEFSCHKNKILEDYPWFSTKNKLGTKKILSNNDFKISNVRWSSFFNHQPVPHLLKTNQLPPGKTPSWVLTLQGELT